MIYTVKPGRAIPLGYLGENRVEAVVFERACWVEAYGPGTFELVHRRANDAEALPVEISAAGGTVTWTPSAGDTAYRGAGECQLSYYTPTGELKKSEVFPTVTQRSLTSSDTVPEPFEGWVQQILAAAAGIENLTAEAVTLEPGSDASVTKTTDPETGVVTLTFGIPQGATGAAGRGISAVAVLSTGEWEIVYTDGTYETVGQDVYAALDLLKDLAQDAASDAATAALGAGSSADAAAEAAESAAESAALAAHDAETAVRSVALGGYIELVTEDEHLIAYIINLDAVTFEAEDERLVLIYG